MGHLSSGPYFGEVDKCTNYRLCQMFPPRSEGGDICHNLTIPFYQRPDSDFPPSDASDRPVSQPHHQRDIETHRCHNQCNHLVVRTVTPGTTRLQTHSLEPP